MRINTRLKFILITGLTMFIAIGQFLPAYAAPNNTGGGGSAVSSNYPSGGPQSDTEGQQYVEQLAAGCNANLTLIGSGPNTTLTGSNVNPACQTDFMDVLFECSDTPKSCQDTNFIDTNAAVDFNNNLNNCASSGLTYSSPIQQGDGSYATRWFVREGVLSSCLSEANNDLTNLSSSGCKVIKPSDPFYSQCMKEKNALNTTLSCYNLYSKNGNTYTISQHGLDYCQGNYNFIANQSILVGENGSISTDTTPLGQVSGSVGQSQSATVQCEDSGFALSWIFCKVIDGASQGIDSVYNNIIEPLLITKPVDLTNDGSPSSTFQIWSTFRIYGDIFLVVCLLVVIFSEAIGGGVFDAYSVRKILPRLLIAAILINLSIYLVAIAIDITNVVGNGIGNLIEQPFNSHIGANTYVLHLDPVTGTIGSAVTVATVVGGIFAAATHLGLVASGLMYLLTVFLIPAFFIFLAILATIVVRRGLILFLLFVSPVAFALYCLPNTERYFRQWWDLLFRALLIYPIIAVLFAMGNVLSITVTSSTNGALDAAISSLVGVISLFIPLFLIPFAFSIAGGMLGRIHELSRRGTGRMSEGILGDKNDPDSLRNRRKRAFAMERNEVGLNSRALSARLQRPQDIFTRAGRARRASTQASYREAMATKLGAEFAESDLLHRANSKNDQYLLAHANEDLAIKKRDKAMKKGDMASVQAWNQAIAAARQAPQSKAAKLASLQALAATGFQFSDGQEGYNELARTAAQLNGMSESDLTTDAAGNITGATGASAGAFSNTMNQAQYNLRTAGRFDLGGINNGGGFDAKAGLDKASLYELANAKPESIRAMVSHLPGGMAQTDAHAVAYQELKAMLPNAKGATRDEIMKQMRDLEFRGVEPYMGAAIPAGQVGHGQKQVRVNYDPAVHTTGWSSAERARGWRTETRDVTFADRAAEQARTYERPDPNNLNP